MILTLENLSGPGKPLRKEAPDAKEYAGLIRSGLKRLADAENPSVSLEGRFDVAYNAAHALCLAALRRLEYRATNRYIVFRWCPIPSVWALRYGASLRNATTYAIAWNMEVRRKSTSDCLRI